MNMFLKFFFFSFFVLTSVFSSGHQESDGDNLGAQSEFDR